MCRKDLNGLYVGAAPPSDTHCGCTRLWNERSLIYPCARSREGTGNILRYFQCWPSLQGTTTSLSLSSRPWLHSRLVLPGSADASVTPQSHYSMSQRNDPSIATTEPPVKRSVFTVPKIIFRKNYYGEHLCIAAQMSRCKLGVW